VYSRSGELREDEGDEEDVDLKAGLTFVCLLSISESIVPIHGISAPLLRM